MFAACQIEEAQTVYTSGIKANKRTIELLISGP